MIALIALGIVATFAAVVGAAVLISIDRAAGLSDHPSTGLAPDRRQSADRRV